MSRRNKTKFEKWFSFSRHKRRFGAEKLSKQISIDFGKQKRTVITDGRKTYTHGSAVSIEEHFLVLRNEFVGERELSWTHAKIIVLIRRDFEAKKHFVIFEQLWHQEKKYLLKNLNTRWLIAATDTFVDYSNDDAICALSLACSCLLNTVKIQATEHLIMQTKNRLDDSKTVHTLQNERVALFDGVSAFAVGTDDTLRNMRWRIDKMAKKNIAGEILLEVFLRLQRHDTVYKRFKDRHARDRTGWW